MRKTTEDDVPPNGRTGQAPSWRVAGGPSGSADSGEPARAGVSSGAGGRPLNWMQGSQLAVIALAIILLAAASGLVGALLWPKTYAARAEVLYPITHEQPTGFLREDRSMTTQLVLMQGRPVLGPIAAQQGRPVEDLQQHITASVLQSSEIIQIQVTDRSAERARTTAQAVVDGYLRLNQTAQADLRQRLNTEMRAANVALTEAQTALSAKQNQVQLGTATAASVAPLQADLQAKQSRQQQLQDQLDALNQDGLSPVAQLLTPTYDAGAVSPRPGFAAGAGALVGVVLAAGVVLALARSWARK